MLIRRRNNITIRIYHVPRSQRDQLRGRQEKKHIIIGVRGNVDDGDGNDDGTTG